MTGLHYMRAIAAAVLILIFCGVAAGIEDACKLDRTDQAPTPALAPVIESGDKDTYFGTIRVYVTEIVSRWDDDAGIPFHNAFLAFGLQENVTLGENDTLTWELLWDGHNYSDGSGDFFDDIQEDNINVIAAVFNADSYTNYSDPPSGQPFAVHEIDACAAAACGQIGYNLAPTGFTHSVLIQDGSTHT